MSSIRRRSTQGILRDLPASNRDGNNDSNGFLRVPGDKPRATTQRPVTRPRRRFHSDNDQSWLGQSMQKLSSIFGRRRISQRGWAKLLFYLFVLVAAVWLIVTLVADPPDPFPSTLPNSAEAVKEAIGPERWLKNLSKKARARHAQVLQSKKRLADIYKSMNVCGPNDVLSKIYGNSALTSTRAHIGSSTRIQRVIQKAFSGQPLCKRMEVMVLVQSSIAFLGGSISACHGLHGEAAHPLGNPLSPQGFPHRIYSWLTQTFPNEDHTVTNGAELKTDTTYFAYCSHMHLPDHVDLVILEFTAEDTSNAEAARSTELLVRSLLLRPQRPAVLMLSSFSPQTQSEHGFYDAEVVHNTVARFYDVPHISVKGLIYHRYLLNSTQVSQTHFLDPILMNESGHTLLADAAIAYLQSEICAHIEAVHYDGSFHEHGTESLLDYESTESASPTEFAGDADIEHKDGSNAESDVPPFLMLDTPDGNWRSRDIVPYCFTANALLHPLPNDALRGTGWTREDAAGFDKKASWFSETPGSRLRIPIEVSAGDVSVRFSQQPIEQGYGRASCWVDDNSSGAVVLVGVTSGPEEVVSNGLTGELATLGQSGCHVWTCVDAFFSNSPSFSSYLFQLLGVPDTSQVTRRSSIQVEAGLGQPLRRRSSALSDGIGPGKAPARHGARGEKDASTSDRLAQSSRSEPLRYLSDILQRPLLVIALVLAVVVYATRNSSVSTSLPFESYSRGHKHKDLGFALDDEDQFLDWIKAPLLEEERPFTYTPKKRSKKLRVLFLHDYLAAVRTYDSFVLDVYKASLEHPYVEAHLWGPHFEGYDLKQHFVKNVERQYGCGYFDIVYTFYGRSAPLLFPPSAVRWWESPVDKAFGCGTIFAIKTGDCTVGQCPEGHFQWLGNITLVRYAMELTEVYSYDRLVDLKEKRLLGYNPPFQLYAHVPDSAHTANYYPPENWEDKVEDVQLFGKSEPYYPLRYKLVAAIEDGETFIKQADSKSNSTYPTREWLATLGPGPPNNLTGDYFEFYYANDAAFAADLRRTKICVFDGSVQKKAIRKYMQASLTGCVIAGEIPDEHQEILRPNMVELKASWPMSRINAILREALADPAELQRKASTMFAYASQHWTSLHEMDNILDLAERYRAGERGYASTVDFASVCRDYFAPNEMNPVYLLTPEMMEAYPIFRYVPPWCTGKDFRTLHPPPRFVRDHNDILPVQPPPKEW
ncbi:hypothetical protein EMMF5_004750 [Cystobasidiomycetes sp. EMM_F5]